MSSLVSKTNRTSYMDTDSFETIEEVNTSLLLTGRLSDVTFMVGEKMEKVIAHKLVLMARSSVFEAMFERWETDKNCQVEIPEVNANAFFIFLYFIYTNKFLVSETNAETVLYLANKYAIKPLENKCANYLVSAIKDHNAIHLFQIARALHNQHFKKACLSYLLMNGKEVLDGEEFEAMDVDTLCDILQPDGLIMHEVDVFQMVMRWARTACVAQEKEPTAKNIRALAEKVIPLIRFTLMLPEDFTSEVVNKLRGLLTDEEIISIFTYFNAGPSLRSELPALPFNTKVRFELAHYYITLYQISVFLWPPDIVPVTEQTVTFSVNKDVFIAGFLLYAPPDNIHVPAAVPMAHGRASVIRRGTRKRQAQSPEGIITMENSENKVMMMEKFEIKDILQRTPAGSICTTLGFKIRRNEIYKIKITVSSNMVLGVGSNLVHKVSVMSRNEPVTFDFSRTPSNTYGLLKSIYFYV